MTDTDQPTSPIQSITTCAREIHVHLHGTMVCFSNPAGPGETFVIGETMYLELYRVLAIEILKRCQGPNAAADGWSQRLRAFATSNPGIVAMLGGGVDAAIATSVAEAPATEEELVALLRGDTLPRGRRLLVMQAALAHTDRCGRHQTKRLDQLEANLERQQSNLANSLLVRLTKLESDTSILRTQQNVQADINTDTKEWLKKLDHEVEVVKTMARRVAAYFGDRPENDAAAVRAQATAPELAGLVELVTGQQAQLEAMQAVLDAAPSLTAELDRRDVASRGYVDEALRKLSTTLRQHVREHVQQALRARPSVLRRVWAALVEPGAPRSEPAPAPPAVPAAVIEQAEQALRRGR